MPVLSVDMKSMPDIIEAQLTFSYSRLSEILRLIVDQGNSHDDELGQLRRRIEALERDNVALHQELEARVESEKAREERDSATQMMFQELWKEIGKLQGAVDSNRAEQDRLGREQRMQTEESKASETGYRRHVDAQLTKAEEAIKLLSSTTAVLYAFYGLWGADDTAVLSMGSRHSVSPGMRPTNKYTGGLNLSGMGKTGGGGTPSATDRGSSAVGHTFGPVHPSSDSTSPLVSPTAAATPTSTEASSGGGLSGRDGSQGRNVGRTGKGGVVVVGGGGMRSGALGEPGCLQHEGGTSIVVGGTFEHSLEARTDFIHHLTAFSNLLDSMEAQRLQQLHNVNPSPQSASSSNSQFHSQSGSNSSVFRRKTSSIGGAGGEGAESTTVKAIDPALEERVDRLETVVKALGEEVNDALLLAGHLANLEEVVDGIQAHHAGIPSEYFPGTREDGKPRRSSAGSPPLEGFFSKTLPRNSSQDGTPTSTGAGNGETGLDGRGGGRGPPQAKFTPSPPPPLLDGNRRTGSSNNSLLPPIYPQKAGNGCVGEFTPNTASGRPTVNGSGFLFPPPGVVTPSGGSVAKSQPFSPSHQMGVELGRSGLGTTSVHSSMSVARGSSATPGGGGELSSGEARSVSLLPPRYLSPPTRLSINVVTTEQPHVEMLRMEEASAAALAAAVGNDGGRLTPSRMKRSDDIGSSNASTSSALTPKVVIPYPEEGLRRRVEAMEENVAMLELKKADRSEVAVLEEALRQLLIQTALARGASVAVDIKYPPMPAAGAINAGRPLYVTASGSIPLRDGEKRTNASVSVVGYELGNGQEKEKR